MLPIKSAGRWIPGRCPQALERKLTGGTSARPFHPPIPVHLVLVIQAILPQQQNLLHFGYIPYNGSAVDLSEVLVSDVIPRLEVDSMTTVSPRTDGGA